MARLKIEDALEAIEADLIRAEKRRPVSIQYGLTDISRKYDDLDREIYAPRDQRNEGKEVLFQLQRSPDGLPFSANPHERTPEPAVSVGRKFVSGLLGGPATVYDMLAGSVTRGQASAGGLMRSLGMDPTALEDMQATHTQGAKPLYEAIMGLGHLGAATQAMTPGPPGLLGTGVRGAGLAVERVMNPSAVRAAKLLAEMERQAAAEVRLAQLKTADNWMEKARAAGRGVPDVDRRSPPMMPGDKPDYVKEVREFQPINDVPVRPYPSMIEDMRGQPVPGNLAPPRLYAWQEPSPRGTYVDRGSDPRRVDDVTLMRGMHKRGVTFGPDGSVPDVMKAKPRDTTYRGDPMHMKELPDSSAKAYPEHAPRLKSVVEALNDPAWQKLWQSNQRAALEGLAKKTNQSVHELATDLAYLSQRYQPSRTFAERGAGGKYQRSEAWHEYQEVMRHRFDTPSVTGRNYTPVQDRNGHWYELETGKKISLDMIESLRRSGDLPDAADIGAAFPKPKSR